MPRAKSLDDGFIDASEAGELEEQKIKMRMIQLSANKLGMISAAYFESVLGAKLTAGAPWHLDRAFLFGLGHTMPPWNFESVESRADHGAERRQPTR